MAEVTRFGRTFIVQEAEEEEVPEAEAPRALPSRRERRQEQARSRAISVGAIREPTDGSQIPGIRPGPDLPAMERAVLEQEILPSGEEILEEVFRGAQIAYARSTAFVENQLGGAEQRRRESELLRTTQGPLARVPEAQQNIDQSIEEAERLQQRLWQFIEIETGMPARSVGGQLVRDLTRFSVGMLAMRGVGGVVTRNPVMQAVIEGALADFIAFSPFEARLSNVVADAEVPVLEHLGRFLQADPDDPLATALFKQGLEGSALGLAAEGVIQGVGRIFSRGQGARRELLAEQAVIRGANESGVPPELAQRARDVVRNEINMPFNPNTEARLVDEFDQMMTAQGIDQEAANGHRSWYRNVLRDNLPLAQPEPGRGARIRSEVRRQDDIVHQQRQQAERGGLGRFRKFIEKQFIDNGTNLRGVLRASGPAGRLAETFWNLTAGAPESANLMANRLIRTVYRGMSIAEEGELNRLIFFRRLQDIYRYRPEYRSGVREIDNLPETQAYPVQRDFAGAADSVQSSPRLQAVNGVLAEMKGELGERMFSDMTRRADAFFEGMQWILDRQFTHGVISADDYAKLQRHDYAPFVRSFGGDDTPIGAGMENWLGGLREVEIGDFDVTALEPSAFRQNAIQLRDTGIKELTGGNQAWIDRDFRSLMGIAYARGERNAMRNRAAQAMAQVAEQGDNPMISLTRTDDADVRIRYYHEGQRREFFINNDLAAEFTVSHDIPLGVRVFGGITTGPTRFFATGINLEFGPVNFIRDLTLTYLQNNLYSRFLPRAIPQMATDLAAMAGDAFRRKGTFNQFMNEGGGMGFLVHQGLRPTGSGTAKTRSGQFFRDLTSFLSYSNENFELWVRLAIRRRALRNQEQTARRTGDVMPVDAGQRATEVARSYLDFSQGGAVTKWLDTLGVPYLNASIQGARSAFRNVKDPIQFATRTGQLFTAYAMFALYNRLTNPEAYERVPDFERAQSLVLTTPASTGLWFEDRITGDRVPAYFRLPVEHSMQWLNVMAQASVDLLMGEEIGPERYGDYLQRSLEAFTNLNIVSGASNPMVSAALALGANLDPFTWRQIWNREQLIEGRDKFFGPDERTRPTGLIPRDIGNLFNIPPAQLERALNSYIPRAEPYSSLVGTGYAYVTRQLMDLGEPGDVRAAPYGQLAEMQRNEVLTRLPFLRRFMGIGHSREHRDVTIRRDRIDENTRAFRLNRQVDALVTREANSAEFTAYLNSNASLSPDERDRLQNRYQTGAAINRLVRGNQLNGLNYSDITDAVAVRDWLSSANNAGQAARLWAEQYVRTFGWEDARQAAAYRRFMELLARSPEIQGYSLRGRFGRELEALRLQPEYSGLIPRLGR